MNKTVLITGASRGIGRAMAELFAYKGYNVLINYNKSEDKVRELYENLKRKNLSVELFKADVSKRDEVDKMVDYCVEKFKGIDILINNAGIVIEGLFTDITEEQWNKNLDVNLKGAFNCTQRVLRYMLPKHEGKIINISSIWGMVGASCEVIYSVAKAGIIGLTKALAKELGPSNIQVNCIAPGLIMTDMTSDFTKEEIREFVDKTPLQRTGQPKDIAACALYLASDDANFITGQVISPNGGYVI